MGKKQLQSKHSTPAVTDTAEQPPRWIQAVFAVLLALSAWALYKSPWVYSPARPEFIKTIIPPLNVIQYNFHRALEGKGVWVDFIWGWLVFISISTWFYVSGKAILPKILNFRQNQPSETFNELSFGEKISVHWFLGSWVWAMVWFALGTAGLFRKDIGTALIVLGLLIFVWKTIRTIQTQNIGEQVKDWIKFDWVKLAAIPIVLWILSWTLLAVFPQYYWDTLMMNMAIPGWYVAEGTFHPNIFHIYTYFAQNNELVSTWTLLAGWSKEGAFLLNWGFIAFILIFLYGWTKRITSRVIALCSIAIFISTPLCEFFAQHIKNDLQVGIFLILQWWALIYAFEKETGNEPDGRNWLFLSGLFSGISFGHKFIAVPSIFVTYLGIAWISFLRSEGTVKKRVSASFKQQGIYVLGFLATAGPWLIRNLIIAGNPIYPFLNGLFGAHYLYPWHHHPGTEYSLSSMGWNGLYKYFNSLWRAMETTWWGPTMPLCISGLIVNFTFCSKDFRWIAVIASISWFFSMFFALKTVTHIGPLLFIFCFCGGLSLCSLWLHKNTVLNGLIVIAIVLALLRGISFSDIKQRIYMSFASLSAGTPIFHTVPQIKNDPATLAPVDEINLLNSLVNKYTTKNDKILFMGTVRPYGIDRKHYFAVSFGMQPIMFYAKQSKDELDLKNRLLSMGIKHIIVDEPALEQWIQNEIVDAPYVHNLKIDFSDTDRIKQFIVKHTYLRFNTNSKKLKWYSIRDDESHTTVGSLPLERDDVYPFPTYFLNLAKAEYTNGKVKDAEIILEMLNSHVLLPDLFTDNNIVLGVFYAQNKDYDKAIACFTRSLQYRISNHYIMALTNRASTYQMMGQNSLALKDWECALAIEPDNQKFLNIVAALNTNKDR